MLIRRFVYENVSKDDIHKLFPTEVLPELQRLLTLLLQKFQLEWRDDLLKDQVRNLIMVYTTSLIYLVTHKNLTLFLNGQYLGQFAPVEGNDMGYGKSRC